MTTKIITKRPKTTIAEKPKSAEDVIFDLHDVSDLPTERQKEIVKVEAVRLYQRIDALFDMTPNPLHAKHIVVALFRLHGIDIPLARAYSQLKYLSDLHRVTSHDEMKGYFIRNARL
jgi:hypothetical protein